MKLALILFRLVLVLFVYVAGFYAGHEWGYWKGYWESYADHAEGREEVYVFDENWRSQ